jgi:branched-chain amino acid transport system permease protein
MAAPRCGDFRVSYESDSRIFETPVGLWSCVAFLAIVLAWPLVATSYQLDLLSRIGIAVIGAVGLNILTGFAGQISIGHAAFIAVGAYTAANLTALGWPVVATVPGAGLAAAAVGMVFGVPSLRLKGLYLAMATLAAHFIIEFVIIRWRSVTGGTDGIVLDTPGLFGFEFDSAARIFYLTYAVAIAAVLFARNLFRTRVGRAFVAIRDRDISAEVMGIPLFGYKLLAFGVSSFYAGVAGALLAYQAGIITPENFPITVAIDYLAMIIIGGLGSVLGAVLGAIFMTLVPDLLRIAATAMSGTFPALIGLIVSLREAVFGLLIVVFLIFEPDGMAARWRTIKAYWKLWPFSY